MKCICACKIDLQIFRILQFFLILCYFFCLRNFLRLVLSFCKLQLRKASPSYGPIYSKENDNGFNNDALTAALMLLANMGVVTIRIYLPMFPSCWLRYFFLFLGDSSGDTAKDNFCVVESSNF